MILRTALRFIEGALLVYVLSTILKVKLFDVKVMTNVLVNTNV